jgi:Family of unknown function (DUF6188)
MESPSFESLIGRRIVEIELVEPISWWFRFHGTGAVRSDSLWRLVHHGSIPITSQDHGQRFGFPQPVDAVQRVNDLVAALTVQRVRLAPDTGDLYLEFDNDSRLEILTTSSGYESWSVFLPDGNEILGVGGGRVHVRTKDR